VSKKADIAILLKTARRGSEPTRRTFFLLHLEIAARENLPVNLHCRDEGDGFAAARVLQLIFQHSYSNLAFH